MTGELHFQQIKPTKFSSGFFFNRGHFRSMKEEKSRFGATRKLPEIGEKIIKIEQKFQKSENMLPNN